MEELKAFADGNLDDPAMMVFVFGRIDIIVRQGKNCCFRLFSPFAIIFLGSLLLKLQWFEARSVKRK